MRKRLTVQIKNVTYSPLDLSDVTTALVKDIELAEDLNSSDIVVLKGTEDPVDVKLYISDGSSSTFDTDVHAIGILNETGIIGDECEVTFIWWKPFVELL